MDAIKGVRSRSVLVLLRFTAPTLSESVALMQAADKARQTCPFVSGDTEVHITHCTGLGQVSEGT